MPRKRSTPPPAPQPNPAPPSFEFASAGRYTQIDEGGRVSQNAAALTRISAARRAGQIQKTAGLFSDGELGPANIADSNNIGYYSFQFPIDQLEQPSSRAQELEYFRMAYTRDPIVARAIDLHTELPLSKMKLEKPKCSVEQFSDYIFDFYQRLMNDTRLFDVLIAATREYNLIGEAFMFVEQPDGYGKLKLSKVAEEAISRGRGYQASATPGLEAENIPLNGTSHEILPDFINSRHKESKKKLRKAARLIEADMADAGIDDDPYEGVEEVHRSIIAHRKKLAFLAKNRIIIQKTAMLKKAAPGDEPPPPPDAGSDAPPADAPDTIPGDPEMGDAEGDPGGDPVDMGGDPGGGGFGGGGGGGFGGPTIPGDMADDAQNAIQTVNDAAHDRTVSELKRVIHLLERKKQLLEELEELEEKQAIEKEIFGHLTNPEFEGFDKIQILEPERITIEKSAESEVSILYKPSAEEKEVMLSDDEVPDDIKETLQAKGMFSLNKDPYRGSYIIHFARKKSGYELHGRSCLQACMRAIIYRDKLRQVQVSLASRNMTPKTLITAPGVSEVQIATLRAHADEAKADPDYTIVTNYEVNWNEIDAQGRMLSLADEWQHTNSNLAIGMGFSPEILIGEGLYGGNRIQLELMNITYTQYRESLSDLVENQIFKPIAILKGFYETDNYGRPRWVYPKITFSQMALRDSGDLYEMLFNMYSRGALPVSTIYEFLGVDADDARREIEADLFTVADSKFNELLSSLYGSIGGEFMAKTNVMNRLSKNMALQEEIEDPNEMEGSGEGM